MPEKKHQHLVPACYLKNFIAAVPGKQKENPNFTSGIYVNDKTLSTGWKLRSVKHKSLTKPYFYNLPEDDPKKPIIENYLSKIEGIYSQIFCEIKNGTITSENMSFMSYFVTLQFMRVDAFIEVSQGAWDQIAEWMDAFDGQEIHKLILKDITKRQLINSDLRHLIHPHSTIIYNATRFPFVTSDNPVVRREINIIDASMAIPQRYLFKYQKRKH